MSGFLFILAIDWVMHQTTTGAGTGIRWKMTRQLEDLDFADDIALVSTTAAQMQRKTTKLSETASKMGLKINQKKSEVLRINSKD